MTEVQKSVRVGVAAFALCLPLAGQAAGIAAADTSDGSTATTQTRTTGHRAPARTARAAKSTPPRSVAARQKAHPVAGAAASDTPLPQVSVGRSTASSAPVHTPDATPAAAVTAPVAAVVAGPVVSPSPATPAPASAVTTPVRLAQAVNRIDHWLNGLPATPVSDLLSGALLIVRRNLQPAATVTAKAVASSTADGTGPVLTDITSTPGSKTIVLTFDGPLIPETATDLANYRITAPGCHTPELVTSSGPAQKIVTAQYSDISSSASQVVLTLARPLRQGTFYRIFINGELPIVNGDPNSNPLTGVGGVTFDGDNDETAGGDFYGLFGVGTKLSFNDFSGDRVKLSTSGGSLNVWRELNGDIDQITALPGATALTGSVTPGRQSPGTVYVGSVTVPVPTPLNLNGAVDNLPGAFETVPQGGLPPSPPEPTAVSPDPILATSQNLPYTLNIAPVSAPGITDLPGIQSGVYAQVAPSRDYPSGLWVVFGGRTNGLHNFSTSGQDSFPPACQNGAIYVINPVDWQVWSMPWSQTNVSASVFNSLTSTSQQSYQKGDTLYVAGGYSAPGTVSFTGNVTAPGPDVTVTSGMENLAVGQKLSGIVPFPSGDYVFPPGTTIAAINGNTITASNPTLVDGTGLSLAASSGAFKTYDTLTALSVQGLAQAVINGGDVTKLAKIRQMSDPRLAVTGGEMGVLNGRTYLAFGHNFQGAYDAEAAAGISQVYSDEVRSFRIRDNGRSLSIGGYQALRDPVNYRRRDGNMVSFIGSGGQNQKVYLGGVFSPGDEGTGYQAPIIIEPNGRVHIDAAYQQFFNQYTTAKIPLYDRSTRSMYDISMGGIGLYYYDNGQLTEDPTLPWTDNVTTLARAADGAFQEYIMSPIAPVTAGGTGYYGANAAFFANSALSTYRNGVIRLNKQSGPTVMGYMYGGIYSTVQSTTTGTFSQTGASNQVFQITLTPTGARA